MAKPVPTSRSPAGQPAGDEPSDHEELIMFLERDQLVADTSQPVPPAPLGPRANLALWGLRVFVLAVSFMVIYTFIRQLR